MAQLIQEAKRFQKLAGILKEAQINPEQSQAIENAIAALTIVSRISSLDTVARQAIEDVLNNILPGITGIDESLNEEEQLDSKEQELVNAVLKDTGANLTGINEGKIDLNKILARVKLLASKNLLTPLMVSTILASCDTAGSSNDMFKRELENAKKVQDLEQVQQAKIDSVTNSMTTGQYK
jgi:hypothetical protein